MTKQERRSRLLLSGAIAFFALSASAQDYGPYTNVQNQYGELLEREGNQRTELVRSIDELLDRARARDPKLTNVLQFTGYSATGYEDVPRLNEVVRNRVVAAGPHTLIVLNGTTHGVGSSYAMIETMRAAGELPSDVQVAGLTVQLEGQIDASMRNSGSGELISAHQDFLLLAKTPDSVGLQISSDFVSRQHAEIEYKNGRFLLTDLGSSNGTSVNGLQVARANLNSGDIVRLYRYEFRFETVDMGKGVFVRLEPMGGAHVGTPEPVLWNIASEPLVIGRGERGDFPRTTDFAIASANRGLRTLLVVLEGDNKVFRETVRLLPEAQARVADGRTISLELVTGLGAMHNASGGRDAATMAATLLQRHRALIPENVSITATVAEQSSRQVERTFLAPMERDALLESHAENEANRVLTEVETDLREDLRQEFLRSAIPSSENLERAIVLVERTRASLSGLGDRPAPGDVFTRVSEVKNDLAERAAVRQGVVRSLEDERLERKWINDRSRTAAEIDEYREARFGRGLSIRKAIRAATKR